jgi:hypothetical protein
MHLLAMTEDRCNSFQGFLNERRESPNGIGEFPRGVGEAPNSVGELLNRVREALGGVAEELIALK